MFRTVFALCVSCLCVSTSVSAQPLPFNDQYTIEFQGVTYGQNQSTFSYRFCWIDSQQSAAQSSNLFEHLVISEPLCEGQEYQVTSVTPSAGVIGYDQHNSLFGGIWANPDIGLQQGQCIDVSYTLNEALEVGLVDAAVKTEECGIERLECPYRQIPGPSCAVYEEPEIPTCAISGPNINIQCEKNPLPRSITGASVMPSNGRTEGITYQWSSNCPRASFSSTTNPQTALMLVPFGPDLQNIACSIQLTVTDTIGGGAASCFSQVTTTGCNFDCNGTWEGAAEFDKCGVCGGNNSTCTNCTQLNTNSLRSQLDGQALQQRNLLLRLISYIPKTPQNLKTIRSLRQTASDLYTTTWKNVWITLPATAQSCTAQPFCSTISVQNQLSTLSNNFSSFLRYSNTAYRAVSVSDSRKRSLAAKTLRLQKAMTGKNLKLLSTFPVTSTSCN